MPGAGGVPGLLETSGAFGKGAALSMTTPLTSTVTIPPTAIYREAGGKWRVEILRDSTR